MKQRRENRLVGRMVDVYEISAIVATAGVFRYIFDMMFYEVK